jgi:hypothetical protein
MAQSLSQNSSAAAERVEDFKDNDGYHWEASSIEQSSDGKICHRLGGF